jgi:hypothetical protein
MKYLKLYENYRDVNLIVKFKDVDEYFRAAEFFKDNSLFTPNDYDSEFLSISFSCTDQDDVDITEKEIKKELDENNFYNYYFESEDTIDSFEDYNERINYDEEEEENEEVEIKNNNIRK